MPSARLRSPFAKTPRAKSPCSTKTMPSILHPSTNPSANPRSSLPSRSTALFIPLIAHLMTIPGASMANVSMLNPAMPLIKPHSSVAFIALWTASRARKRAERWSLCPAVSPLNCRSGRSPALPYPAAKSLQFSTPSPFWNRTFLLCRKLDISILH